MSIFRWFKCRFGYCGGGVVSGWRGNVLCIGWRCATCGKVKHYGPSLVKAPSDDR